MRCQPNRVRSKSEVAAVLRRDVRRSACRTKARRHGESRGLILRSKAGHLPRRVVEHELNTVDAAFGDRLPRHEALERDVGMRNVPERVDARDDDAFAEARPSFWRALDPLSKLRHEGLEIDRARRRRWLHGIDEGRARHEPRSHGGPASPPKNTAGVANHQMASSRLRETLRRYVAMGTRRGV